MKYIKSFLAILLFLSVAAKVYYRSVKVIEAGQRDIGKKAVVIGASSGIGKAIAQVLSKNGYTVGLAARRGEALKAIALHVPNNSVVKEVDVSQPDRAIECIQSLIDELGGLDLMVINAGIGFPDSSLDWENQRKVLDVNVIGFAAMANVALKHFVAQKSGHLVGISSILALRGIPNSFTYCATKAFDSRLLEGIRNTMKFNKLPIYVTDIQPGFVDTPMVKDIPDKIWVATPEEAAEQIYEAIKAKKEHAYVTKRWRIIAWFLQWAPDWLLIKFFN